MERGIAIVLILTVFRLVITGSDFDKINAPGKKDKMLMYMRGLMKLEATTTRVTSKPTPLALPPGSLTVEQIWDAKKPDRSDKSSMLAYLRGLKNPNSIVNVFEQPRSMTLERKIGEDIQNAGKDIQSRVIDSSAEDTERKALMENPGATTNIAILQPDAKKESQSDTCFWRGERQLDDAQRQQLVQRSKGKPDTTNTGKSGNTTDLNFENMGENVINFFNCLKTKFWKSYEKIQNKICNIFEG